MLKTFEKSKEDFFFKYVEKVSLPQRSKIFEKGKNIHALASYYLQGFDITKMEKVLTENEKQNWENLKTSKYFKYELINSEYNLSCKIGEYWVGGRLDAFVKNNKDYYILDYKTGQIPQNAQYDYQTMIYLLCADKFLKGDYASLHFIYLGLKNGEEKEILLNKDLKKEYETKIVSICDEITKEIKIHK